MPKAISDVKWYSMRLDPDGKLTIWLNYLDASGKVVGSPDPISHQVTDADMVTLKAMLTPVLDAYKLAEGI